MEGIDKIEAMLFGLESSHLFLGRSRKRNNGTERKAKVG
jgi:hypothetical protein